MHVPARLLVVAGARASPTPSTISPRSPHDLLAASRHLAPSAGALQLLLEPDELPCPAAVLLAGRDAIVPAHRIDELRFKWRHNRCDPCGITEVALEFHPGEAEKS